MKLFCRFSFAFPDARKSRSKLGSLASIFYPQFVEWHAALNAAFASGIAAPRAKIRLKVSHKSRLYDVVHCTLNSKHSVQCSQITKALLFCLQQVFMIKPIENSPQCMIWVPYTKSVHEDAVLFGDDQGYVCCISPHSPSPFSVFSSFPIL